MRFLWFVFVFLLVTPTLGQLDYAKTILDSICHPRYDGRGYVNNGDNRAAEFIIRELKAIGVKPFKRKTFAQFYKLNVNTFPGEVELWLDQKKLSPGADYILEPTSGSADGTFSIKEINQYNIRTLLNQERLKEEKNTLFAFNFSDITDQAERNEYRKVAQYAMQFFPVVWIEKGKLTYSVGREQQKHPLITMDSSSYFTAQTATLKIESKYVPNYESQNVIGVIPGRKKRKYIVLTAHYDHLGRMGKDTYFPGANDNASGVAMLLSLAKYYTEHKPDYSIVFCFFSGEEAGLEGSKYFVQHPFFKLKKVKFVLNIDILGSAAKGITVVNGIEHLNQYNRMVELNQEGNYLGIVKKRGLTANSDHYFFTQSGVPAFFIYSLGDVKNYHDIYDTADNTPLTNFEAVQQLLTDFIAEF